MIGDAAAPEVVRLGCFGKLPLSREFIVEGPLAGSGFDRWLSDGVGLAKARLGARFDERISSFPRYRFFWDGLHERLAGVIIPSADAAGRKHPFAVFATLRGRRTSALENALQICAIQEQIATLVATLIGSETTAALHEMIQVRLASSPTDTEEIQAQYQAFIAQTPAHAYWRGLGQAGEGDGRYDIVQTLCETIRHVADGNFRGGIRFPLAGTDRAIAVLEPCFWLDLAEKLRGRKLDATWWLRAPAGTPSDRRHLFLFLSAPSASQWVSVVEPEDSVETISYLDRPYGLPARQRMSEGLRGLLAAEDATLADYLLRIRTA